MFDVSNTTQPTKNEPFCENCASGLPRSQLRACWPGIGIGAMLSGRPTVAQPDMQIARAPEALSASFAEIARRVEPAVVNIETTQPSRRSAKKTKTRKINQPTIRCSTCFAGANDGQPEASAADSSSVPKATS
jgi:S1-C subfamily serine protease